MSEAEVNNERTTLDYLNEYCWRAVLQYVPAQDLIRTERASLRWQELVLMYLRGVQIIIEKDAYDCNEDDENESKGMQHVHNTCTLNFTHDINSFECWAKKLGTSVVATYCNSLESLAVIKEYCPNIKSLQLFDVEVQTSEQLLPHNLHDNFKLLHGVYFLYCDISDLDVSLFIANKALKELEFHYCDKLTGLCFNTINWSNIQRFVLDCSTPKSEYILPAIERFGELKELKLVYIDTEILEQIQLVLDKMPKLECLIMYNCDAMSWHSSVPLSWLSRLKHLSMSFQMSDWEVAEVIRCCRELQTLELCDCVCLIPGFVGPLFRHAGARLATLQLGRLAARDNDVVALVRACPQLTSLTVRGAYVLTRELPVRAAAARRRVSPGRPLWLDLSRTNLTFHNDVERDHYKQYLYNEMKTNYEDLILVLDYTEDDDTADEDNEDYWG